MDLTSLLATFLRSLYSGILALKAAGAATSYTAITKKVTGLADAALTDVLTVTVPNLSGCASIRLWLMASTGSTDAFESTRVIEAMYVFTRVAGGTATAAIATAISSQITTVSSGATLTIAQGLSNVVGAASATQTFTIQVTLNDSGNVGSNQLVMYAELLNAEAAGITMA